MCVYSLCTEEGRSAGQDSKLRGDGGATAAAGGGSHFQLFEIEGCVFFMTSYSRSRAVRIPIGQFEIASALFES